MPSQLDNTAPRRLTGFQILEPENNLDIYTLILQTEEGEWIYVADRQMIQSIARLACARVENPVQKNET